MDPITSLTSGFTSHGEGSGQNSDRVSTSLPAGIDASQNSGSHGNPHQGDNDDSQTVQATDPFGIIGSNDAKVSGNTGTDFTAGLGMLGLTGNQTTGAGEGSIRPHVNP